MIVRYGNIFAFIYLLSNGHVTVSFKLAAKLDDEVSLISGDIERTAAD